MWDVKDGKDVEDGKVVDKCGTWRTGRTGRT